MKRRDGAAAAFKKSWRNGWGLVNRKIDENVDPKTKLSLAINQAKDDHNRVVDSGATVIAAQKQAEMDLDRMMDELEDLTNRQRAAIQLEAKYKVSDPTRSAKYTEEAREITQDKNQLAHDIEVQKQLVMQTAAAALRARQQVEAHDDQVKDALREQNRLLAANAQAEMQENMNSAMANLTGAIGDGITPTLTEVRQQIESRQAKALGVSELQGAGDLDLQNELRAVAEGGDADAELDRLRAEMGYLNPAPAPTAELPSGNPEDVPR